MALGRRIAKVSKTVFNNGQGAIRIMLNKIRRVRYN